MRILISRLSALGDVVCTLPAAHALHRTFPEAEIVWWADKRFSGILECCPWVNEIVIAPQILIEQKETVRGLGQFDLALDLQGLMKSALPIFWSKAERKLGYHWQREGALLLVSPVTPDPSSIHVTDQYIDVARAAGAQDLPTEYGLTPPDTDLETVRSKMRDSGWNEAKKLTIMNAGAGWVTKRWNPAHFAQVADELIESGGQVLFLGTKMDRPAFEEVRSAMHQEPIDFLSQTSVRELVSLVSLCDLHIAGDTGSTHLATGLGKPTIGVYTLTRPERSGPYGQLDRAKSLDPVEVLAMAKEILAFT
ncbi:MAG: glycosyltransferase family 9 protein [Armatimonadetes bacterium]|nr:glycosyltransferase family 9 protein [Armatimonadota bacterium]